MGMGLLFDVRRAGITVLISAIMFSTQAVRAAQPVTANTALDQLHAALLPLRTLHPRSEPDRRACSAQMSAKHLLRDWIADQLPQSTVSTDWNAVSESLNSQLRSADLLIPEAHEPDASDGCGQSGYLGQIRLSYDASSHALVIITRLMAAYCGVDDSAYVFTRHGENWAEIWRFEERTQAASSDPQWIVAIHVSQAQSANQHLILQLGTSTWCTSVHGTVDYSLWQADDFGGQAHLLIHERTNAIDDAGPIIEGSLSSDEASVQFRAESLDNDAWSYHAIRHIKITNGAAERVDPVARGPQDFIEEWLSATPRQRRVWETPNGSARLDQWSLLLHPGQRGQYVEFPGKALRCRIEPETWEIDLRFGSAPETMRAAYILVQAAAPQVYRVAQISNQPAKSCSD